MFGANLRVLARNYPSISELSRQLGINRTQFNRYLAGDSFPRPDVLARICDFFGVDARVLLDPVDSFDAGQSALNGPELGDFLGTGMEPPITDFPDGFYRFTRKSFLDQSRYVLGLVWVWRNASGACFMRGYEAREAMYQQGLSKVPGMREFRGLVMQQENGIAIMVSRRNAMTSSFNFLHPVASFENNFWVGYVARTIPENVGVSRATRMVYEHIGNDFSTALQVARGAGLIDESEMPSFHLRMIQSDADFR
ncbi:MAG: helix-turn-helix transcriptional regulator [Aliishimia sp.]